MVDLAIMISQIACQLSSWQTVNLKFKFSILIYFKMYFIPVMAKLNFQQSLLQSSVSRDPSEIILIYWFAAPENVLFLF